MSIKLGFCGMTHLGMNYLVASASKGCDVIGYHSEKNLIQQLKEHSFPIVEPGLFERYLELEDKIDFTSDIGILSTCEIAFISYDVPTSSSGESDLTAINTTIDKLIQEANYTGLIVILSQVSPGFTQSIQYPKEKLYYQVETLIFGEALSRAEFPERLIIGCSESINSHYRKYLELFNCPILEMDYNSAELTKIAINLHLISQVSTTNLLATVCEEMDANIYAIRDALKLDKRIGRYAYLNPGLGLSGGNLERDLSTMGTLLKKYSQPSHLISAQQELSKYRKNWLITTIEPYLLSQDTKNIAILGLTYKKNTHSLKNSPALRLIEYLKTFNVDIRGYDPKAQEVVQDKFTRCENVSSALINVDIVVVATSWPEFEAINWSQIVGIDTLMCVIDPFSLVPEQYRATSKIYYHALGVTNHFEKIEEDSYA